MSNIRYLPIFVIFLYLYTHLSWDSFARISFGKSWNLKPWASEIGFMSFIILFFQLSFTAILLWGVDLWAAAVEWFRFCLSNRIHFVAAKSFCSVRKVFGCDESQSSFFGPLIFLIHASTSLIYISDSFTMMGCCIVLSLIWSRYTAKHR